MNAGFDCGLVLLPVPEVAIDVAFVPTFFGVVVNETLSVAHQFVSVISCS